MQLCFSGLLQLLLTPPKFLSNFQCPEVSPVFPAAGQLLLHQAGQGCATGGKHLLELGFALERCLKKIARPFYSEITLIEPKFDLPNPRSGQCRQPDGNRLRQRYLI